MPKAMRSASARAGEAGAATATSDDIAEQAHQPDPKPADGARDGVGVGIDDDAHLGIVATARRGAFALYIEAYGESLRVADPARLVRDGRQSAKARASGLTAAGTACDAPSDRGDGRPVNPAGERVEDDL